VLVATPLHYQPPHPHQWTLVSISLTTRPNYWSEIYQFTVYLVFNGDAPETMEEEEERWLDVSELLCCLMIFLQGEHDPRHPPAVRKRGRDCMQA